MKEKLALQWFADCVYESISKRQLKASTLKGKSQNPEHINLLFFRLNLGSKFTSREKKGIKSSPPPKKEALIKQSLLSALTEYDMPLFYDIWVFMRISFRIWLVYRHDPNTIGSLWMFHCPNTFYFTSVISQKFSQNLMIKNILWDSVEARKMKSNFSHAL